MKLYLVKVKGWKKPEGVYLSLSVAQSHQKKMIAQGKVATVVMSEVKASQ